MRRYIITAADIIGLLGISVFIEWAAGKGFRLPSTTSFATMISIVALLRVNGGKS